MKVLMMIQGGGHKAVAMVGIMDWSSPLEGYIITGNRAILRSSWVQEYGDDEMRRSRVQWCIKN
jgi:hypothetical protein